MARTVRVDIVTPDKLAYSGDVNMVIARATDGDLGVLPGHVPLIAALNTWPLRLLTADGEHQISLCGGFIEVQGTAEGAPFQSEDFNAMLALAQKGMNEIFELQQASLAD